MPSNIGRFRGTEMACSVLEGQLARSVNITEVRVNPNHSHAV